jgi:hypothetical protein
MFYCEPAMLNERCDSAFKKRILLKCYDALEAVGYRRYRKAEVDWPLDNGFHGWVGLNNALYTDRFCIEPFVGIHSVSIHKLWYKLEGSKYPGKYGCTATYAIHIGELDGAKDNIAFVFGPQQSESFIDSEVKRLAELYATVGMDYARSIASYAILLPLLQERVPIKGGYPQRVTSCLYLMGRKNEAREFVNIYLPGNEDTFGGFAESFLKTLNGESGTNNPAHWNASL